MVWLPRGGMEIRIAGRLIPSCWLAGRLIDDNTLRFSWWIDVQKEARPSVQSPQDGNRFVLGST
jgi:hypothetical protein